MSARDLRLLYGLEMRAVVDLAACEPPAQLGRDLIYCRFPLHDDGSNSEQLLCSALDCIASLIRNGHRTLVACSAGMSRSPVMAAAAISTLTKEPLADALTRIVAGGPRDVSPAFFAAVASSHKKRQALRQQRPTR